MDEERTPGPSDQTGTSARPSVRDEKGNEIHLSVLDYLTSYEQCAPQLRESKFNRVKTRAARMPGENLLKRWGLNHTRIVAELMNIETVPSHGQMISAERAELMKLKVERMSTDDPLWRRLWQLYCYYRVTMARADITKIFESAVASNSEN